MALPGTHRRGVRAIGVFLKFRSIGLQIVNPGNSVLSQGISKIFVRQTSASLDRILVVERRRSPGLTAPSTPSPATGVMPDRDNGPC